MGYSGIREDDGWNAEVLVTVQHGGFEGFSHSAMTPATHIGSRDILLRHVR